MDNKSPEAFRTISEVADWLGVPAHVLRFWESRFGQVKPVKRAGGRRYYRPSDMELLGGIRKLLHEDGMTIRGVQKLLRENGVRYVAAMSPPIDQSGDLRDVSPADAPEAQAQAQAVPSRRAAPVFDDDIEDAVEAEATPRTEIEAGTETEIEAQTEVEPLAEAGAQDAPPVPASEPDMRAATGETPQDPAPEPAPTGATPPVQEPVQETPETGSEPLPELQSQADEAASAAEDAAARPEPVTVEADTPVLVGAPDMAADGARPEDGAEGADEAPLEDTLEALEFLSHEAEPASGEGPDALPDTLSAATETPGPADAPDLAATGRLTPLPPDLAARDTAVTETSPEPEAPEIAAPENAEQEAPPAADPAPPKAPGPDLVLPDIGPDPEDDAGPQPGPALAAALRRGRSPRHRAAGPGRLNPALIQAYADRLQALSGRLGTTPDGRRPF